MTEAVVPPAPAGAGEQRWLSPGVRGIGTASLLADAGHEVPTALLPSLLATTLRAPAAALGVIEGVSDGLAGLARLAGGAIADDPGRRPTTAVGGYAATAVLAAATGAATARSGTPARRRPGNGSRCASGSGRSCQAGSVRSWWPSRPSRSATSPPRC